jgi:hypothetical protein
VTALNLLAVLDLSHVGMAAVWRTQTSAEYCQIVQRHRRGGEHPLGMLVDIIVAGVAMGLVLGIWKLATTMVW